MSALILKVIACLAMLTDHIGFFRPIKHYLVLRAIGRIAFPIFAWNIGNGYSHTRNRTRYFLTLLAAGIISEVPFDLCFSGEPFDFENCNVMFTLALGLFAITLIDRIPAVLKSVKPFIAKTLGVILIAAPLAFLAERIGADFGACGVMLIIALWLAGDRKPWMVAIVIVFALRSVIGALFGNIIAGCGFAVGKGITHGSALSVDYAAVLAIDLLLFYNGKSGMEKLSARRKAAVKYAFYGFYPAHLMILYFILR